MKKFYRFLLLLSLLASNMIHAQVKHYDFNILAYGGIGFGVIGNENQPNYSLNSNHTNLLLKYRITYKLGIATGVGLNQLSGDGFNSLGNFHHERILIKIPLAAVLDYPISDNFSVVPKMGLFTQYIVKDEHRFLSGTQKSIFGGWNIGAQIGVGLLFNISSNLSVGFNYNIQFDISEFKSNHILYIDEKQKLNKLNTMGIVLVIEL